MIETNMKEEILFQFSFPLPPSLYRIAAGDADDGGEVDLSVHADGAHAVDRPVLADTAIQTPLCQ